MKRIRHLSLRQDLEKNFFKNKNTIKNYKKEILYFLNFTFIHYLSVWFKFFLPTEPKIHQLHPPQRNNTPPEVAII